MRIAVVSDGGWGTAIALLLLENGHDVVLWGPFPDYVEAMASSRRNDRFLPGVALPDALQLTGRMATALSGAGMIVLASPTQYARKVMKTVAASGFDPRQPVVNLAKGIEEQTCHRLSEIAAETLGACDYAVLSGPSHAEEVSRRVPTAVTVASLRPEVAEVVQQTFMNEHFRVYTSDDVVGVELGGALKNVFAIAAGVCDGMELGDNPKAALVTRGIAELSRLGHALGGRPETFSGLSGIGDMIVTCCSGHSRNRHVGEELGRGRDLETIVAEMGMVVAEGVRTARSARELARRAGVDTPIIDQVHASLYEGKDPRQAVRDLMTRQPKMETD